MPDVFMCKEVLCNVLTCVHGLSAKSRGQGTSGCITYFDSTQFAVYNGMTHNPQNPSDPE